MRTVLAILATLALATSALSADLKVGSKAPKLTIAKWFKGTPIKEFKKGNVYVVEFWATWCGPCIDSMPHISKLARQYRGKVSFTGVNVWEEREPKNDAYLAGVAKFVKGQGKNMDYNVAAEGHKGVMAKTWLEAAGQDGIPCAFVVDKQGKIAWIGHPMELDSVLPKFVKGK